MISIRPAVENDIEVLCSIDSIAQRENERREFIRRVVISGECVVAARGEKVIGYGVFNYSFYHSGFIEMIYIRSDYRRSGAGAALENFRNRYFDWTRVFPFIQRNFYLSC
jgi:ribosomal protein S18 acetylase RimI-like enzyme